MESRYSEADELRQLENMLGCGSGGPEKLSGLLADDCVEIGASGQRYNKHDILAALTQRADGDVSLSGFKVRSLGPNVALTTYCACQRMETAPEYSLRSSIWVKTEGRWQLLFHQGTQTPCP